jgi:predicted nuclease of predicted toxin-antitoxin system
MILIIDEDVPRSVTEFLRGREHEVYLSTELLLPPTPDRTIAAKANQMSAIVVTCDKDFDRLIQRNNLRFRSAGRISLRCNQARARDRLAQAIDLIEFAHHRRRELPDKRLIVDVKDSNVVFLS